LRAKIENQTFEDFPYSIGISLDNIDVADSYSSAGETRLDLNLQTILPVAFSPIQMEFHGMTASGGLGFIDVSGGVQNYWYTGLLFEGSLHLYWAKRMSGQHLLRLHPHLKVSYPLSLRHCVYMSYKPIVIPMTLASDLHVNRCLSTISLIRHTDVSNSGERSALNPIGMSRSEAVYRRM